MAKLRNMVDNQIMTMLGPVCTHLFFSIFQYDFVFLALLYETIFAGFVSNLGPHAINI
jgi:hypothetical protein